MSHADLTREARTGLVQNQTAAFDMSPEKGAEAWRVLQEYAKKPFDWNGMGDCCAFANELVKVFHDLDIMEPFIYKNKAEALQAIREHGDLVGAITSVMGDPRPVKPEDLRTGDVLIAKQVDGTWIPGIYLMGRMVVRTKEGIMDWPIEFAQHYWRPGECHKLSKPQS